MTATFIGLTLHAMIAAGTGLLIACIGEIFTQKAGILNLGIEGMMIIGAAIGIIGAVEFESVMIGVLLAIIAGALMGLLHAFITITCKASQVVSGLALTIFGVGLANFLGSDYVGLAIPNAAEPILIPVLSTIPVLGPMLFSHHLLVYLSFLLVPLAWFYVSKTRMGISLRAVGENPAAADSAGIRVVPLRFVYTAVGGALAGLGGAYLSLNYYNTWINTLTSGQGWIVVALVIFSKWSPVRAMVGSYLFGFVMILGLRLQAIGISVPSSFFSMLPYIVTFLVLVISGIKAKQGGKHKTEEPQALGVYYDRESR